MKLVHFGRFALAASGLTVAVAMPAQAQLATNTFATQATVIVAPTIIETTARGSASSMSGSGLDTITLPVIDADGVVTAGAANAADDLAFTFAQSVSPLDTVGAVTIPADGLVTTTPDYSNYTIQGGGVADTLAGTALSSGTGTITAGGVGTTATLLQQRTLTVFK